jgi:hypothetical protein
MSLVQDLHTFMSTTMCVDNLLKNIHNTQWIASNLLDFFLWSLHLYLYVQLNFSMSRINWLDCDTQADLPLKMMGKFSPDKCACTHACTASLDQFWTPFIFTQSSRCHFKQILIPCHFHVVHFQLYILVMYPWWNSNGRRNR